MTRPRHREKSSLLWKMVGIAGVINLILWPALIHEGVFAGIRQEVLIPVTLVSVPPSHKAPDELRVVSRTPPRPPVRAPSSTPPRRQVLLSVPHQRPPAPRASVPPRLTAVATPAILKSAPKLHSVASAAAPVKVDPGTVSFGKPLLVPVSSLTPHTRPGVAHIAARQPRLIATAPVRPSQTKTTISRRHLALAARIARAKQLEAEGHQVAELIAQQRGVREAALPPPAPTVPIVVTPEKMSPPVPVTGMAPSPYHGAPPPKYNDVPAVIVRKVNPTVPDAMMNSTWHTTFHGEFTVHRNGKATVRMISSTGFPALDRRAMEAAHQWKFQPARRNGVAVPSIQPFAFEYDVHPSR